MLQIENDGANIVNTNFWQTEQARRGSFFLSVNAGAFRLLIPDQHKDIIAEFETATDVILSRGPWPDGGQRTALELLFDDGSDDPYSIHLGENQVDRWPLPEDAGRTRIFTAWIWQDGKPHCAYFSDCFYRIAPRLPWLKPRLSR